MADRHDPRYVDSMHRGVRYVAVVRGSVRLGGWTGEEHTLAEFREAVRDQHRMATGEDLRDDEIEVEQVGC